MRRDWWCFAADGVAGCEGAGWGTVEGGAVWRNIALQQVCDGSEVAGRRQTAGVEAGEAAAAAAAATATATAVRVALFARGGATMQRCSSLVECGWAGW